MRAEARRHTIREKCIVFFFLLGFYVNASFNVGWLNRFVSFFFFLWIISFSSLERIAFMCVVVVVCCMLEVYVVFVYFLFDYLIG